MEEQLHLGALIVGSILLGALVIAFMMCCFCAIRGHCTGRLKRAEKKWKKKLAQSPQNDPRQFLNPALPLQASAPPPIYVDAPPVYEEFISFEEGPSAPPDYLTNKDYTPPTDTTPPEMGAPPAYIENPSLCEDSGMIQRQQRQQQQQVKGGMGCWQGFQAQPHLLATFLTLGVLSHLFMLFTCYGLSSLGLSRENLGEEGGCYDYIIYNQEVYIGVTATFVALYYLECCCSASARFLSNIQRSEEGMREEIERLRSTRPTLWWRVQCYHYETRYRTVTSTDSNGKTTTRTESYQVRVNTHSATGNYKFRWVRDMSGDSYLSWTDLLLVKAKFSKIFTFADEATRRDYNLQMNLFKMYNNRDTHMDFSSGMELRGFKKRCLMEKFPGIIPEGLNLGYYLLASLFFMTVPYRWWFSSITQSRRYLFVKEIKA